MPKVIVVIPTYNERSNLQRLIEQIFSLKIPNLEVLVVDDNSPDGTGELAEKLAEKYSILVIHRNKKDGLGRAYIEAFKYIIGSDSAITRGEPSRTIIQMDADLSHDPIVIPKMLEKIKDCDVILGSRYVSGGRIENWNFFRLLVSRFGNFYARLVLGLPYRDLTGGFKCWRREVLEKLDLDSLSSTGYNFQIETTYKTHQLGYKICEIPITFTERKTGISKFNLRIILEAFWKVFMLRLK